VNEVEGKSEIRGWPGTPFGEKIVFPD